MELFMSSLIVGIVTGCVYGLMALSLVIIFNPTRIVNFAAGDLAMLGMYGGFLVSVQWGLTPLLGMVGALVLSVVASCLIAVFVVEPMIRLRTDPINIILGTLAVGMIGVSLVGLETRYELLPVTYILGNTSHTIGPVHIAPQHIVVVSVTIVIAIAYWIFLKKTMLGLKVRAAGNDPVMASLVGIKLRNIRLTAWIMAGLVTGVAGFIVAPLVLPNAQMGLPLVVKGFVAGVFGGWGDPYGALLGGLVVGLGASFFGSYIDPSNIDFMLFGGLLLVLAFRPSGLRGSHALS